MRHDFTIFVQHHNWLLIKPVCSMTYKQNCKRNKECNKRIIKFATSSSTPRAVITTVANSSVAYFTCSLLCSSHHPPWPPPHQLLHHLTWIFPCFIDPNLSCKSTSNIHSLTILTLRFSNLASPSLPQTVNTNYPKAWFRGSAVIGFVVWQSFVNTKFFHLLQALTGTDSQSSLIPNS